MAEVSFFIAALIALFGAVGTVLLKNPFYAVLALVCHLLGLAALFLLLRAEFVAAAQVIVYAGAVMIMFLFVIAYLGGRADEPTHDVPLWQLGAAVVAGAAIVIEVVVAVATHTFDHSATVSDQFGSPQAISESFFSTTERS